MPEFFAQCRTDEAAKQRMRTMWTRTIFGMELRREKPGMVLEFHDLDKPAIR